MNFKIGLHTICLALASSIVSAIYPSGPCMNDVWQNTGNSGTALNCNANEVSTTVLGVDGPTSCMKGDIIVVNVTTSIYFRASRYDFAIYTLTDNSGASDPIFGSECAIDVLGQTDADFAPENIQNQDRDACFDVVANSGWTLEQFQFQDNLHVPCEGEPGRLKYIVDATEIDQYLSNIMLPLLQALPHKLCISKTASAGAAMVKMKCVLRNTRPTLALHLSAIVHRWTSAS